MKSFLLRIKGTIFASAQIQKMTVKMSEKIMWSTFTGRLTEFELKNPPWDFHGLKNTCSFTCKRTTKSIESCVYLTDFFFLHVFLWGIIYRCELYCVVCACDLKPRATGTFLTTAFTRNPIDSQVRAPLDYDIICKRSIKSTTVQGLLSASENFVTPNTTDKLT